MARENRRMALYEAIRKGQSKRRGREKTARFRPFASARRRTARKKKDIAFYQRLEAGSDSGKTKAAALWSRRLNLSLSYPVAGFLVVAVAALVIAAIRFGQINYDAGWLFFQPVVVSENASDELVDIKNLINSTAADGVNDSETTSTDNEIAQDGKIEETKVIVPQGNNVIVIQEYRSSWDLGPVKKHFEDNGIETEILERRGYFFLVTKARFRGVGPGADGEPVLKKIVEIGATYNAPPEYESFRPNLFKGAYGRKLDYFLGE